jgi:hypothetical protein
VQRSSLAIIVKLKPRSVSQIPALLQLLQSPWQIPCQCLAVLLLRDLISFLLAPMTSRYSVANLSSLSARQMTTAGGVSVLTVSIPTDALPTMVAFLVLNAVAAHVLGSDGGLLLVNDGGMLESVAVASSDCMNVAALSRKEDLLGKRGLFPLNRVGLLQGDEAMRVRTLLTRSLHLPASDSQGDTC